MSSPERPDANAKAFQELDLLVRNLGEELATFRKRAHTAEARLKAIATRGGGGDEHAEERVSQLEAENTALRGRLGFSGLPSGPLPKVASAPFSVRSAWA